MEETISLPNSETRKLLIGQDAGEAEDIISKLPENILLYILTFLPINDVLKTSALSRRWKNLWSSIYDIDIDDTKHNLRSRVDTGFLKSADRVLLHHDSSSIRKLRIMLNMRVSASKVSSWISAAVSHHVQELDFCVPFKMFPENIFTAESLRLLKLKTNIIFKVPGVVHLPNLKSLHLKVVFESDQSSAQFFSCCARLQELVLDDCVWIYTKRITISIPTLRALTVYFGPFSLDYLLDCAITIRAEHLISLDFTSKLIVEPFLCNLSSLVNAHIGFDNSVLMLHEVSRRALKFLGGLRNVRSLTLSNNTLKCLSTEKNLLALLPAFHNLTHFKVNIGSPEYISGALMCFLEKSPNLESLQIPKGFLPDEDWDFYVPLCIMLRLKTVSISKFNGSVVEVLFLKYLLENGAMLEKLSIFCSQTFLADLERQEEIKHQLQAIFRVSTSCVIDFCNLKVKL